MRQHAMPLNTFLRSRIVVRYARWCASIARGHATRPTWPGASLAMWSIEHAYAVWQVR